MKLYQKRSGKLARLNYLLTVPLCAGLLCASTMAFSKNYGLININLNKQTNKELTSVTSSKITDQTDTIKRKRSISKNTKLPPPPPPPIERVKSMSEPAPPPPPPAQPKQLENRPLPPPPPPAKRRSSAKSNLSKGSVKFPLPKSELNKGKKQLKETDKLETSVQLPAIRSVWNDTFPYFPSFNKQKNQAPAC